MTDDIRIERDNGVLTLTLARAERKNALTNAMYGALADQLEAAGADSSVRVVLLKGDGDLFCAGNDIGEFALQAEGKGPKERQVFRFLRALARATVPIVAAVQGKAVGIGTTMLLHCDLVVLADDAQLVTPFVNLALVPEAASSLLLPQRIGHARAFEMFALGEPVASGEALAWGLANRVVPRADLDVVARDLAQRLASRPRGSVTATKRLMRQADVIVAQMDTESETFMKRLKGPEAREAFRAFAEKRAPDFNGIADSEA